MRIKQKEILFDIAMQNDNEFEDVKKLHLEIKSLKAELLQKESEIFRQGSNKAFF